MIEVEVKLRIRNYDTVKEYLVNNGFELSEVLAETDTYYDNRAGQIRNGDSALRIRHTENLLTGQSNAAVTYKGPKMDNKSMTRPESETEIGNPEVFDSILRSLGFYPVDPRVVKQREQYTRGDLHACLDRVEGLGDFLELEIMVDEPENTIDARTKEKDRADAVPGHSSALELIEKELHSIGYSIEDTTNISYLTQLQSKQIKSDIIE